jgi:ABC-type sulfate/molybdate transport systems ATPase subunit
MSADALEVTIASRGSEGFELDVSFTVTPGITTLFGPSGAGKTTLLRLIAGLTTPSRGVIRLGSEVWFDSQSSQPPEQRRCALLFQRLALFPHLTVEENVRFGLTALSQVEQHRRALEVLEQFKAAGLASRAVNTLSGGEAQRVALARAMAPRPRVLLLDEPFSSLDQRLKAELLGEVRRVVEQAPLPTIIVTHDDRDVAPLNARTVRIEAGRLVSGAGHTADLVR